MKLFFSVLNETNLACGKNVNREQMTFELHPEPDVNEFNLNLCMDNLDNAKHDHQKNKSDIVNLVKQMFAQNKWGDEEYRRIRRTSEKR